MADEIDALMSEGQQGGQGGGPFLPGEADNDPLKGGGLTDPTSFIEAGLGGAAEAAFQTKDAVTSLLPGEAGPKGEMRTAIEDRTSALTGQSTLDALSKGISQFAVGFIGLGKVLKPFKMAGKVYDAARGAAVGAVMFDPHEARLSNLVEEFPALQNPVTAYLAASKDDTAAEGRFKAVVENLLLPGAAEAGLAGAKASARVLTKLVSAIRLRRLGDIKGANAAAAEADDALEKANHAGGPGAKDGPDSAIAGGDSPASPLGEAPDGAGVLGDPPPGAPQGQGAKPGDVGPGQAGGGDAGVRAGEGPAAKAIRAVPSAERVTPDRALPDRVEFTPEQVTGLIKKGQADVGAILDAGSYEAAVADGHVFAQSDDLIPWQKFNVGSERAEAWMARVVSEQEQFVQKQRGGNAEGVLKDRSVQRMVDARVRVFGEDPELVRGLILKAGDNARSLVANMETAYVIANKGMADTYGLAMRINAGNLGGFESEEAAKIALKARLTHTMELFAAAKSMTAAGARATRRMRSEFTANLDQLQKANLDAADPDALTKLILSTKGDPKAMADIAKPGIIGQATDALSTMQAANLLWSWKTQVINMGMNLFTLYQRPFTQWLGGKVLQAGAAAARNQALLAEAGSAASLARRQMVTTHTYLYDAWKAAGQAFMVGDSTLAPHANEFTSSTKGVTRIGVNPVGEYAQWREVNGLDDVAYNASMAAAWFAKNKGEVAVAGLTMPLRVMGAADEFTKTLRYRAVVASKADADALAQGLKPGSKAYKDYVLRRVEDAFDDMGAALDVDALQEAKVTTFQQDLLGSGTDDTVGGWKSMGALVQQGVNSVPPARLVLPFVKTPANLFRYGQRLTPGLNLLQKQYLNALTGKAGPEAQAMATGEMMLGIMLASTAVGLRLNGRIIGGGPVDYKASKSWKADGNMPYSIVSTKPDGTKSYFQFSRLDPVQFPLAAVADAADLLMQGHLTEDQEAGLAMAVVLSLAHQLKNKTYLQNVSQFLDSISDDNKLKKLPERMAPGFLPFSTLLQGVTQMQDPILHEVHGLMDALKARTPGFSDDVPPRRDWGGDIVMAPGAFLSDQKLSPKLAQALDDMHRATGTYLQPPSPRMDRAPGVDLRDLTLENGRNAYDRYQELAGNPTGKLPLKEALNRLVQTGAFKVLPHGRMSETGTKENALHKIAEDFRQAGMARLLAESPQMRQVALQRHQDLLGQLQVNAKDLRVSKSRGAAEGINEMLGQFGLSVPVPSGDLPAQ